MFDTSVTITWIASASSILTYNQRNALFQEFTSNIWKCCNPLYLIGYFKKQTFWIDKEFGKYRISSKTLRTRKNKSIKNKREKKKKELPR